jgi:5-methylcytosine-specific restriction enzyme A
MIEHLENSLLGDYFPTSQYGGNHSNSKFKDLKAIVEAAAKDLEDLIPDEFFEVKYSTAQGNIADTPWIGIHSKEDSVYGDPQRGIYLVFLWKVDGTGVSLSLNFGTTFLGTKDIRPQASHRRTFYSVSNFGEEIDLASKSANTPKGRPWKYEQGNIEGKDYDLNTLPEILVDLPIFLEDYGSLVKQRTKQKLLREEIDKEDINHKNPPTKGKKTTGKAYNTSRSERDKALRNAGYLCEIDNTHETFRISIEESGKKLKAWFMEGHHLIPMEYQDKYLPTSLDFFENIVSLCPNCHAKIHYSDIKTKKRMVEQLFENRKEQIQKVVNIDLGTLLALYCEDLG